MTPDIQPVISSWSVSRLPPAGSALTTWRPTIRTPGCRDSQANTRPSSSSVTVQSPAARPFCLTCAVLPSAIGPGEVRRTSS